jgi:hypothetical protein
VRVVSRSGLGTVRAILIADEYKALAENDIGYLPD